MFVPQDAGYIPQVVIHVAAGGTAILTGYAAVSVRKGERLHRAFGNAFAGAMLIMAGVGVYLALSLRGLLPGQMGNVAGGILAAYLVSTGWMAAKRSDGAIGTFERLALGVVALLSIVFLYWGWRAATSAAGKLDGYRPVFYCVFSGIAALLAAIDLKVILTGGLTGVQRIARHLWRMCFAVFFAAGSFFLGQQKVMPPWMHGAWYLTVLAFFPLAAMAFWLIRVRIGRRFKTAAALPA
jgi:hypothetical protein